MCEINVHQMSESIATFRKVYNFWNLYLSNKTLTTPKFPLKWHTDNENCLPTEMEIDCGTDEMCLIIIANVKTDRSF